MEVELKSLAVELRGIISDIQSKVQALPPELPQRPAAVDHQELTQGDSKQHVEECDDQWGEPAALQQPRPLGFSEGNVPEGFPKPPLQQQPCSAPWAMPEYNSRPFTQAQRWANHGHDRRVPPSMPMQSWGEPQQHQIGSPDLQPTNLDGRFAEHDHGQPPLHNPTAQFGAMSSPLGGAYMSPMGAAIKNAAQLHPPLQNSGWDRKDWLINSKVPKPISEKPSNRPGEY